MAQNPRTPLPLRGAHAVSFPEVWVESSCQQRNWQAFEDVTDLMSHLIIAYIMLTYQPLLPSIPLLGKAMHIDTGCANKDLDVSSQEFTPNMQISYYLLQTSP